MLLTRMRRRLRALFRRSDVEREMRDELALHFDLHAKALEARGWEPAAARRQAAIDFAGLERVKESYRDARGVRPLETLAQDVRYAVRTLLSQRVFTASVIGTFAIGIGATTAIYSLVDAAWFSWSRSFSEADRLVMVYKNFRNGDYGTTTPVDFRDWRDQNRSLSGIAAYVRGSATIIAGGEPMGRSSVAVSPDFFSVLAVRPLHGRFFRPDEERWGNNGRVVLSHRTWRNDFGGDPGVIGRMVSLNGSPAEIIGVAPRGSWFGSNPPEVFIPLSFAPGDPINTRNSHFVFAIGRMAVGQTITSANADLTLVANRIAAANPQNDGTGARAVLLSEVALGEVRSTLTMLLAAAALLLVISCANVTNLLLVRTTGRAREIAVRAALGASRSRLTQQLWTESVLLAAAGGVLGVAVAAVIVRAFGGSLPMDLPRLADTGVPVAWRVMGLSLVIVLGAGIICGSLPAMQLIKGDRGSDALRQGSRTVAGGRRASIVRGALVSAQVAFALMLLVTTALLTRSLAELQGQDHGANATGVLTARLTLPANARRDTAGIIRYYDELLRRAREIPGVTQVGVASHIPMGGGGETKSFWVEGRQPATLNDVARVMGRMESADALRAMGVTLLSGRWFAESDREDAPYVAIVGESVAKKHFGGENPIGKRISLYPPEALSANPSRQRPRFTVIGVIRDVRYGGAAEEKEDAAYVHYPQARRVWVWGPEWLVVKTAQPVSMIADDIREAIRAGDPTLPVGAVIPLEGRMADALRAPRFTAGLIATFAAVAVLLGIIGLYGVIAYSVGQETKSIGVRLALGATAGEISWLIVRRGALLALVGIGVGVLGAFGAARLMSAQLFGVSPADWVSYLASAVVLMLLATLASWLPARRAAATDAVTALRSD